MACSMPKFMVFLTALLSLSSFTTQQHIFDETCQLRAVGAMRSEMLKFASQTFHISSRYLDVYVNFCKPVQNGDANCKPTSQVCAVRKSNKQMVLQKVVSAFQAVIEYDNVTKGETVYLKTNDLGDCAAGGKYQLRVMISKQVTDNSITYNDECTLEITIPHPNVTKRNCAFAYQGLVIDMAPLRRYPELAIALNTSSVKLALCHNADSCEKTGGSAICELQQGGGVFSVSDTQSVLYNEAQNLVVIRGYKQQGKLRSEVIVRCNWTANFENARKQLANYKYTVDSKLGCVKTPLNCQIADIENYQYDLSSLNRSAGWAVRNTTGTMRINVCGPLKRTATTPCAAIYAQACLGALSYGALHSGLRFEGANIVLTYTHGSQCAARPDEYLSTRVTFECAAKEAGPVLASLVNCTADIVWKTPQACAKSIADDSSFGYSRVVQSLRRTDDLACTVYHNGQLFDLGGLKSQGMSFESRAVRGRKYHLNVCRPIAITRENYPCGVTAACMEDAEQVDLKERFKWFGGLSAPKFENDELIIRYEGKFCKATTRWEILISFNCSQRQESPKLVNEMPCRTDFLWNTPLACKKKTQRSVNCRLIDQSGRPVNFEKIQPHRFQIQHGTATYDVDLCADQIIISSNSTDLNAGLINTTRRLSEHQCRYSMLYTLANSTVGALGVQGCKRLQTISVDVLCDDIVNNPDHIYNYTVDGCAVNVSLETSHVCNILKCRLYPQKTTQPEPATADDTGLTPIALKPVVCKIIEHNRTWIINTWNFNITASTSLAQRSDIYTVGNSAGNNCKGFICKNNQTLAVLDVCPAVRIGEEVAQIVVTFSGEACNHGFHTVTVVLHCANSFHAAITKNEECATDIAIECNDTCNLLDINKAQLQGLPNNEVYIVGIAILIAIVLASIFAIWRCKLRRGRLSCDGGDCARDPGQRTLLYFRNASD